MKQIQIFSFDVLFFQNEVEICCDVATFLSIKWVICLLLRKLSLAHIFACSFGSFEDSLCFVLSDAPPVMLNSFIEQTLQPGPAVSLMCVATANPPPKFTWTLDGFAVRLKILIHFLNEKKNEMHTV